MRLVRDCASEPGLACSLHFPFHDLAQCGINASLVAAAVLFEPGQHVGIEPQRNWPLQRAVEVRDLHAVQRHTLLGIRRGGQAQALRSLRSFV